MKVTVSLDDKEYKKKPDGKEYALITKRIAKNPVNIDAEELADVVGNKGRAFCPAIFKDKKRLSGSFEQMQLFALDFDSGISFEEIRNTAEEYSLPISFAYYTLSSTIEHPRFRIVFISDVIITDKRAAEIMINMLQQIFIKADKGCKDVSRLFLGGKGIFYGVHEDKINIISLAESYQRYIFKEQPTNYVRNINDLAKKYDVACINNCLQIFCVNNSGESEEFLDSDIYLYGSHTINSSNFGYVIHTHYQKDVRKPCTNQEAVRFKNGVLKEKCRLYSDFINELHISYDERYLLMLNLIYMNGGRKKFMRIICDKDYDIEKWKFNVKYAKDKGYKPKSCKGNCPYDMSCHHKENIINTVKVSEKIKRIEVEDKYYSLDDVYKHMCYSLNKAISCPGGGIHLISAQTAVGKTNAYCDLLCSQSEHRFLIAVPTNRLKREIEERLQIGGADFLVTESIDEMELPEELKEKVEYYYNLGLGQKIAAMLREFIKINEDNNDFKMVLAVSQCREYLNLNSKLNDKKHMITTHARLATLSEDIIRRYIVIIDEDILATFFKNIRTVSVEAVKNAIKSDDCPFILRERLRQVLNIKDGNYCKINESISVNCFSEDALERLEIWDNVNDMALASVYHRDGENIVYFYPQDLPNGKYIVMSATSCLNLYKKYFSDKRVIDYPYKKARYKGSIKQFTNRSLSRQDIKNNMMALNDILIKISKAYSVITFKEFEDKGSTIKLHFGNTEGVDFLKGKDIAIVGTPHLNEFVYKLIGCHLGMEVNNDVLTVRRIEYKGYKFCFMTYKQKELRELQLYFISKELEQSIGRARLLRNDCKVIVFSNFPCEQAELVQDDYLEPDFQEEMKASLLS